MLEAVNHHAAAFGLRINTLKTKVMSVRIPGEQRQVVANAQGTEEVRNKTSSTFFVLSGLISVWSSFGC